jgi:CHAT domain-containing protein
VYAQLALVEQERGRVGAAFDASERLRAREMLEMLARGRITTRADASEDIVTREQDLRRRIAELTRGLENVEPGDQAVRGSDVAVSSSVTRETLVRAQGAYADLLLEARERAPRHAALVAPDVVTWQSVARRLTNNAVFIEYLVSDSTTLGFVVTSDTIAVLDLGTRRHDLARLIDFTRATLARRGSGGIDSLWRAPLRRLHATLVAPLEQTGLLAGKTRLVVVPHVELQYLPFAALIDSVGRFLVERYELAMTPSASVWIALGDRPAGPAGAGVLAFAPRPMTLPGSSQEVATIQRLARVDARVLTGSAATESAFRRLAPTQRVLHLATYGVLNKQNPLFSFVQLAPDGAEDGRLEVHEVFGLSLTCRRPGGRRLGRADARVHARRCATRCLDAVAGGRLGHGRVDGAVLWCGRRRGRAGAGAGRGATGAAKDAGDDASVLLGGICGSGGQPVSKRPDRVRRIMTTRERGRCAR